MLGRNRHTISEWREIYKDNDENFNSVLNLYLAHSMQTEYDWFTVTRLLESYFNKISYTPCREGTIAASKSDGTKNSIKFEDLEMCWYLLVPDTGEYSNISCISSSFTIPSWFENTQEWVYEGETALKVERAPSSTKTMSITNSHVTFENTGEVITGPAGTDTVINFTLTTPFHHSTEEEYYSDLHDRMENMIPYKLNIGQYIYDDSLTYDQNEQNATEWWQDGGILEDSLYQLLIFDVDGNYHEIGICPIVNLPEDKYCFGCNPVDCKAHMTVKRTDYQDGTFSYALDIIGIDNQMLSNAIDDAASIVFRYPVVVSGHAVTGDKGNNNVFWQTTYGPNRPTKNWDRVETKVFTYGIEVTKITEDNTLLPGASFSLQQLISISNNAEIELYIYIYIWWCLGYGWLFAYYLGPV